MAKLKLYPNKIHIPELGRQAVAIIVNFCHQSLILENSFSPAIFLSPRVYQG